jgi:hypothetical protein
MIGRTRATAEDEDRIKNEFEFTVSNVSESRSEPRIFRDPLALEVHRRLAAQLRMDGFDVTDAKPGKACDAAFSVKFPKFNVFVMIAAERPNYAILTWCSRPLWTTVPPREVSDDWVRTCDGIEKALKQDLNVSSIKRFPRKQSNERGG